MTTKQATLIGRMCQDVTETQLFFKAFKELLSTCSDSVPGPDAKPQVVVAFTASQSQPAPPSTPKAMGPEWWNDRLNTQIKDLTQENDDLIDQTWIWSMRSTIGALRTDTPLWSRTSALLSSDALSFRRNWRLPVRSGRPSSRWVII